LSGRPSVISIPLIYCYVLYLSAIRFAVNLQQYCRKPISEADSIPESYTISEAYFSAIAQFRALRSEQHIATTFAAIEAEAFGIAFEETEVEKVFSKHIKELEKWGDEEELDDESANAAKKRWRGIVERNVEQSKWTKGEQYVKLWKDSATAEYAPMLTQPIPQHISTDTVENQVITS
jgi:small subunit ribosomal protein S23